mmetsp:Transcript_21210/g.58919  ORF Transcript_21210/g.58919 Transcript_21210/m.58919 type:complete len:213 (+) Transcript_21210:1005-1643(+)
MITTRILWSPSPMQLWCSPSVKLLRRSAIAASSAPSRRSARSSCRTTPCCRCTPQACVTSTPQSESPSGRLPAAAKCSAPQLTAARWPSPFLVGTLSTLSSTPAATSWRPRRKICEVTSPLSTSLRYPRGGSAASSWRWATMPRRSASSAWIRTTAWQPLLCRPYRLCRRASSLLTAPPPGSHPARRTPAPGACSSTPALLMACCCARKWTA